MKKTGKRILGFFLAVLMLVGLAVPTGILAPTAKADVGQTPDHHKSVSSNEDGTYTIELTVTGDADTEVETAANVNVIIVYDVSQSMTNDAPNSNRSRADNAEDVVHKFIDGLAKYQSGDGSNIEVALVTFGPNATIRQQWTSDLSTETGINQYFDLDVDGNVTAAHNYGSNLGTNWEHALIQAQSLLTTLDNRTTPDTDPTFVIFVTDGVCTKSGTASGNGESPTNTRWSHYTQYYTAASDNAFAIEQRADTTLFGIYAYGTEADLLDDLVYYANTPNEAGTAGTHRTMTVNGTTRSITDIPDSGNDYRTYTFGNTITETTNYFNATNTDALNSAIQSIFTTIVEALGVSSVEIKDGTTNEVKVGTETVELLEVDESSYKYWLSIPIVNNEFQRVDLVSGETITYTVSDDGKTVSWPTGNSVEVNGTIANGYLKYQWTEANALYNKEPPGAKLVDGEVQWDLSSLNALLDGVIYSVTFTCYPSQTTLDYVADIKNDPYVDDEHPGAWGDLPAAVQKYIGTDGSLITNTNTNLHWVDTREDDPEGHDEAFTDKIDPVENDAIEQLTVSKDWKNLLASDWTKPDKIDLVVTRDNDPCYTVTLSNGNDWASKVFISVGIMGADGQPLDGAAGHDFAFTEPETEEGFKWQINAPTVHPMLIENKVKMLIKVDAKHPLPDDATTYEFNDATYYVDEETVSLTATNERRSSINVVKTVEGVDIPEDATFPFTITVIDSLAPKTPPATDTNHESDYWLWFSIRDKDGQGVDNGVENATSDGGGYWYAPSGTSVTISAKAGYSIRLMNLPTGSTYTIVEGDLPTGFIYDNTTIALTQGEGVWKYELDRTTSGSVDTTNAVYTITYKNKYELVDINVDKVWDDNDDQDGKRPDPEEFTLTLNGLPEGTEAPEPEIEIDGNTWTYTWKAVPRYDAQGNELTYTVTEDEAPEGYKPSGSPAKDGGTITNTHETENTSVTVTKVWEDNDDQDGIRPETLALTLNCLPEGTKAPEPKITKEGNTWTYKWSDVPKFNDGDEIKYTVTEETIPDGYSCKSATVDAGGTITNSYTPGTTTVTVTKVWEDNNDQDGMRPDSLTLTLKGDGKEIADVTPEITKSEDGNTWTYTWSGLPKNSNGNAIEYTVTEAKVPEGYECKENEVKAGGTITNTHTAETVDVTVTKVWDDEDDKDGKRPASLELTLEGLPEGVKAPEPKVTKDGSKWTYTWSGLPKNSDGNAIEYTVTEAKVPEGYECKENEVKAGGTITNTHTAETVDVTVTKVWDDEDDKDGKRPASLELTLEGLPEGVKASEPKVTKDGSKWTYTWSGLPKYSAGEEIKYTVTEEEVPEGYECEESTAEAGGTITNSYTPGVQELKVKKVWVDGNDKDKLRPDSIDVKLILNGKTCETQTLNAGNNWQYTWKVPVSEDLVYTVDEDVVPNGYVYKITGDVKTGFTITNTHETTPTPPPPVIRIEIVKVWEDNSNASGTRTDTVQVMLLKGGVTNLTRTLGDSNEWKYEGYVEGGYDYKVIETPVEGYESIVTQSPIPGGIRFTVTNKLTNTPALNTEDHVAYIVGYPDGTVRPGKEITRAEVATIFFRLLTDEARDKYWSQTNPYPDVAPDAWYNNAISTLTKMGIINGYEDGTFRPNNPITRAELTKMAVSFFSSADQYFGKTPSFSDVPADAWYTRFIAAAEELGLINGYPDGTFRPANNITRAETCTIVNRTLGRVPHKDHLLPYEEMINWPDNTPDAWYYAQIQEASNSHDYDWITEQIENTTVEDWTAKLPERDWVALEQVWSTSHSAPGGEVMG